MPLKMLSTYNSWNALSDKEAVAQIGAQVKEMRLAQNRSQAEVAKVAGLDRTTVVKLEAGRAATLLTLVQVLRALGKMELLELFVQRSGPTPMQLMEQQERYGRNKRKRASKSKPKPPAPPKSEW